MSKVAGLFLVVFLSAGFMLAGYVVRAWVQSPGLAIIAGLTLVVAILVAAGGLLSEADE